MLLEDLRMGKIYKGDFENKKQKTKTISELFESIQLYRSEGKSLPSIHAAFQRSGLWKKSLSSFLKDYYQHRSSGKEAKNEKSKPTAPSQVSSLWSKDGLTASSPPEEKSQVDSRTGIKPEMTLAEKREISARLFKQNQRKQ